MTAYYNEFDPKAADWLRELIREGLIAPGDVDTRDIRDVFPSDLEGYTQHHFFAGIGVWSAALRVAGWPDDREVWTASCPCQPFSAAGRGAGFADERHLWPAVFHLVNKCRPVRVFGEQVASKDGLTWLDLVQADMEDANYTFGAVDTCAAGFGAPHIRQRLYWMADRNDARLEGRRQSGRERTAQRLTRPRGVVSGLALADSIPGRQGGADARGRHPRSDAETRTGFGSGIRTGGSGPTNGLWRVADWLLCRDEKWRPVEPGTFPLADAGAFGNRVAELRGAGNALNLAQAAYFVDAVLAELG